MKSGELVICENLIMKLEIMFIEICFNFIKNNLISKIRLITKPLNQLCSLSKKDYIIVYAILNLKVNFSRNIL